MLIWLTRMPISSQSGTLGRVRTYNMKAGTELPIIFALLEHLRQEAPCSGRHRNGFIWKDLLNRAKGVSKGIIDSGTCVVR